MALLTINLAAILPATNSIKDLKHSTNSTHFLAVSSRERLDILDPTNDGQIVQRISSEKQIPLLDMDGGGDLKTLFLSQQTTLTDVTISRISRNRQNFNITSMATFHIEPNEAPNGKLSVDRKTNTIYILVANQVFELDPADGVAPKSVIRFSPEKKPKNIAFNSCQRKLYVLFEDALSEFDLEDNNVSHERVLKTGSFDGKLFKYFGGKLFYRLQQTQLHYGFQLESTDVYSEKTQKICSSDKEVSITSMDVYNSSLFYLTDSHNMILWEVDAKQQPCKMTPLKRMSPTQPTKIVTMTHDDDENCLKTNHSSTSFPPPIIPVETPKPKIEDQRGACKKFCLGQESVCSLTSLGLPVCHCPPGWTGDRCQISRCYNFCLNDGTCNPTKTTPWCLCPENFHGHRCQFSYNNQSSVNLPISGDEKNSSSSYYYAFVAMLFMNLIMVPFLLGAVITVCRRRKTDTLQEKCDTHEKDEEKEILPTIVKKTSRTRVFSTSSSNGDATNKRSKNVGKLDESQINGGYVACCSDTPKTDTSCNAFISDDGVVLDLEDCCHMTLCDTPCVEAVYRKPAQRRGHKFLDTLPSPTKSSLKSDQQQLLFNKEDELF